MSKHKKIDAYIKKERRNTIVLIVFGLIIVLSIISWITLPPLGATTQVSGVVIRLDDFPVDGKEMLFLLVELDDGKKVKSYIKDSSLYKKGRKVNLEKKESLFIGRTVYRFRGYIDNAGKNNKPDIDEGI